MGLGWGPWVLGLGRYGTSFVLLLGNGSGLRDLTEALAVPFGALLFTAEPLSVGVPLVAVLPTGDANPFSRAMLFT